MAEAVEERKRMLQSGALGGFEGVADGELQRFRKEAEFYLAAAAAAQKEGIETTEWMYNNYAEKELPDFVSDAAGVDRREKLKQLAARADSLERQSRAHRFIKWGRALKVIMDEWAAGRSPKFGPYVAEELGGGITKEDAEKQAADEKAAAADAKKQAAALAAEEKRAAADKAAADKRAADEKAAADKQAAADKEAEEQRAADQKAADDAEAEKAESDDDKQAAADKTESTEEEAAAREKWEESEPGLHELKRQVGDKTIRVLFGRDANPDGSTGDTWGFELADDSGLLEIGDNGIASEADAKQAAEKALREWTPQTPKTPKKGEGYVPGRGQKVPSGAPLTAEVLDDMRGVPAGTTAREMEEGGGEATIKFDGQPAEKPPPKETAKPPTAAAAPATPAAAAPKATSGAPDFGIANPTGGKVVWQREKDEADEEGEYTGQTYAQLNGRQAEYIPFKEGDEKVYGLFGRDISVEGGRQPVVFRARYPTEEAVRKVASAFLTDGRIPAIPSDSMWDSAAKGGEIWVNNAVKEARETAKEAAESNRLKKRNAGLRPLVDLSRHSMADAVAVHQILTKAAAGVVSAKGFNFEYPIALGGFTFMGGFAFSSDGHILKAAPVKYPADWERRSIGGQGAGTKKNPVKWDFYEGLVSPDYLSVIPHGKGAASWSFGAGAVSAAKKQIEEQGKKLREDDRIQHERKTPDSLALTLERHTTILSMPSDKRPLSLYFDSKQLLSVLSFLEGGGGVRVFDRMYYGSPVVFSADDGRTALLMPIFSSNADYEPIMMSPEGEFLGQGKLDYGAAYFGGDLPRDRGVSPSFSAALDMENRLKAIRNAAPRRHAEPRQQSAREGGEGGRAVG